MRFAKIYEEFGKGIAFVSSERQRSTVTGVAHITEMTTSKPRYKARIKLPMATVMSATIDIPNYYTPEIPPTPVTEAKDLTYYKSDEYPKPSDE